MTIIEFLFLGYANGVDLRPILQPSCPDEREVRQLALSAVRRFLRENVYSEEIVVFPERIEDAIVVRASAHSFLIRSFVSVRSPSESYDQAVFEATATLEPNVGWSVTNLRYPQHRGIYSFANVAT